MMIITPKIFHSILLRLSKDEYYLYLLVKINLELPGGCESP